MGLAMTTLAAHQRHGLVPEPGGVPPVCPVLIAMLLLALGAISARAQETGPTVLIRGPHPDNV